MKTFLIILIAGYFILLNVLLFIKDQHIAELEDTVRVLERLRDYVQQHSKH